MLDPVSDQEIKCRFTDRKKGVQEIIDFCCSLENQHGNNWDAPDEDQIQKDQVQIKFLRHCADQLSPDWEHEKEGNINIQEIIGRCQGRGVSHGEKFGNMSCDGKRQVMIKPDIVDQ